jgi:asparagine synthetase B (glutamine-hydrolysing)
MPAALMSAEEKARTVAYVLDALSEGRLLAEIADEMGIKRPTLFAYCHETAELSDKYARAREDGLHARGERLRALTDKPMPLLNSGGVDSGAVAQLRIQVDAEKWMLSKLLPHVYGDKIQTEHSGSVEVVSKDQRDAAVRAAMKADE